MKTLIFIGLIFLLVPILSSTPINESQVNGEIIEMDQFPMSQISIFNDGAFIQNIGQEDEDIDFTGKFNDYHVILGRSYFSINNYEIIHKDVEKSIESNIIRYNFIDCNEVVPEGYIARNYSYNFFIGNNSSNWFENVYLFERVKYENIWDGIDIIFYSGNNILKYDIIVHPYSNIDDIKIQLVGQESLRVEEDRLIMDFENDRCLIDGDLFCHYLNDDERINAKYVMKEDNIFSFQMDTFDLSRTMIIDPLISSTYIGGSLSDRSLKVLADDDYIYIAGITESIDFPTTPGTYCLVIGDITDLFVSKFDKDLKNLIFSTYVGGIDEDKLSDLELCDNGDIFISGYTKSTDYPITDDAFDKNFSKTEIFISKISSNGSSLLYSTFIGGVSSDSGGYMEIDKDDNLIIAGGTVSIDFPNTSHPYNSSKFGEAFLMKMDHTGKNVIFSRTFGGSSTTDVVTDLDIDIYKNIYLTGYTASDDFPVTIDAFDKSFNGDYSDVFFMKFNSNSGEIRYSSYFGGQGIESKPRIISDSDENIYVTGITSSSYKFPITQGCYDDHFNGKYDSFLFKYDLRTNKLNFSTFLGGGSNDGRQYQDTNSLLLDNEGYLYISGGAYSDEFPVTANSYDTNYNGNRDIFLSKMSNNGSEMLYSTFIGGPFDDNSYGIYFDKDENAIITGATQSGSFPTTDNSYDPSYNGYWDCFVLKLNLSVPPGKPINLSARSGDAFVNITWKKPLIDGNATILGYQIFRRSNEEEYEIISSLNRTLYYHDTGLTNGTTYHYIVRAFNFAGSGNFSSEINATPIARPHPPIDLNAEALDSLVNLSWKPPLYDGGSPVSRYNLYRGSKSDELDLRSPLDGTTLSFSDSDVQNGDRYFYCIAAVNDAGESIPSKIASAVPMGLPSPPIIISNTSGPDFIRIKWEAPEDNGGSEILGYRIYKGTKNGTEPFLHSVGKNVEVYNDTSIQIGITFHYYVTAINEIGESPPSNRMAVILIVKPDQPESFKATGFDGYVELSWSKPYSGGGSDIVSYNIYKGDDQDDLDLLVSVNGGSSSFKDTDVENGRYYYYWISAVNDRYESDFSELIKAIPMGRTSPPVIVDYDAGDNFVHLYWEEPDDLGGDPDFSYILYRIESDGELEEIGKLDGSVHDYNDTDVTNGVEYRYYLRVKNLKGLSDPSNTISVTPLGLPSPVTDIRTTEGNGFILLHWTLPDEDGGANITRLIILRSESNRIFSVLKEIDLGSSIGVEEGLNNYYNDTSAINGIRYFYYILVENVVGRSSPSEEVDYMARGVPQPPSGISISSDENTVFLNWSPPKNDGGSTLLKYMIYRSLNGDEFELVDVISRDQNSWIDDDLNNGMYVYLVIAVNEYGESDPMETSAIEIDHSDQENHLLKDILLVLILIIIFSVFLLSFIIFIRKMRSSTDNNEIHVIDGGYIDDDNRIDGEDSIVSENE